MVDLADILDKLINGNIETRIKASNSIREFGSEAVEPLIGLIENPDNYDSWWLIAEALGTIGDERAVEPLIQLLNSPKSFEAILARKYTAEALGVLGDSRAVDTLIEMLKDRIYEEEEDGFVIDEPNQESIEVAIWALTEIGDLRGLSPIIQRSFEEDYYCTGSILTKWGEPAFKLLVGELRSDDENKRGIAASMLGEFGDRRAVTLLIELLKNDRSKRVRHSAAYALSELNDAQAFDALLGALDDSYEQTRIFATMGLGNLKDIRAIDALKKATHDEDATVRNSARQALEFIQGSATE